MNENKKTFKEVVKEHKHQIITGAACVTTVVVSGILLKDKIDIKVLKEQLKTATLDNAEKMKYLYDKVDYIQAAMSEGMVQEAIATTTRKLNVRYDIIARFKDSLDDVCKKEKYEKALEEAVVFERRLKVFNKLLDVYFIEE